MDGFALYVTNTSTIPPDGYLCYEDPDPGLPNITQTIPCNELGKYVIYYNNKGSNDGSSVNGPIVELCYVAINGCQKSRWGSNCEEFCSENCIEQHCYLRNGSCVWGCNTNNCLNDICNTFSGVCTDGCKERLTGNYCNKYNMASDGLVELIPKGSQPGSLANDGNKTSCSKTMGPTVTFQVDLQTKSIVTGVYITFGGIPDKYYNGWLSYLYASNTSISWENGTVLYQGKSLPTEIYFNVVFRYLTYVPPVQDISSELEVCEIGIIGCPPSRYGPICNESCPGNCNGPCDLETGNCVFGCLDGWTGDKCGQECPDGQFGRNCSQFCNGCISNICDHVNGLCDNSTGCNPGYVYGNFCNTTCQAGTYGNDCLETCSVNCFNQTCNKITGECLLGCNSGWLGFNCTQECPNGKFGRNCSEFCKGCISNMCDPVNGLCDNTTAIKPGNEYRNSCNPVSTNKAETDHPVSTQIGLFTGGCLFGSLVTAIVCFLLMRKGQLRKRQGKEKCQLNLFFLQLFKMYTPQGNKPNIQVRFRYQYMGKPTISS
ncbi:unnamed protein product [Mytilus coruscus]|uniref:MEGF10_11 n=1 Tax=Mytilus coruscus TaxID=42192 RepID=A0A6J8EC17_MYTCO|nr:unnamed protein product [Mytilus coruscus]